MSVVVMLDEAGVRVTYHQTSDEMWRVDVRLADGVGAWSAHTHYGPSVDPRRDAATWAISIIGSRLRVLSDETQRMADAVRLLAHDDAREQAAEQKEAGRP